ncbi:MAG: hypothetical protein HKN80_01955 [Acidimicrobiia bacterium]|nr:hypothetical protein [Acidimicrobiia bacterium]NNC91234.1 hypothetical protein [Acidimicrobiia bacterium]
MIFNENLARAINEDRLRRPAGEAPVDERSYIKQAVGRWLEHIGKKLQGLPEPGRSTI